MKHLNLLVLVILGLSQTGCAGFNQRLKEFLGGEPESAKNASTLTKFSDGGDVLPPVRRQYKRTTKESLADQAALDQHAGSLWVMEGQGAYLFSQNIVRLVGDPLAVQLDGDPKDQLNSKVSVIRKLLARIEAKNKALREPAGAPGAAAAPEPAAAPAADKADKKDAKAEDKADDIGLKNVPTRIVERTVEGNYRVKGAQPFLINNREYKVIVTGVVRAEDFNDEGIPSSKLIDPKFDIVSSRRHEAEL